MRKTFLCVFLTREHVVVVVAVVVGADDFFPISKYCRSPLVSRILIMAQCFWKSQVVSDGWVPPCISYFLNLAGRGSKKPGSKDRVVEHCGGNAAAIHERSRRGSRNQPLLFLSWMDHTHQASNLAMTCILVFLFPNGTPTRQR